MHHLHNGGVCMICIVMGVCGNQKNYPVLKLVRTTDQGHYSLWCAQLIKKLFRKSTKRSKINLNLLFEQTSIRSVYFLTLCWDSFYVCRCLHGHSRERALYRLGRPRKQCKSYLFFLAWVDRQVGILLLSFPPNSRAS